jgi:hypothetical protein
MFFNFFTRVNTLTQIPFIFSHIIHSYWRFSYSHLQFYLHSVFRSKFWKNYLTALACYIFCQYVPGLIIQIIFRGSYVPWSSSLRNWTKRVWQCDGVLSTLRHMFENLILGPSRTAKSRLLSFNRTQSRAVIGLLTGHNTLRRHLYITGLIDSPLCMRCGLEEETSPHGLSECEALASLRHTHLGSFLLDPEDVRSLSMGRGGGAFWKFSKGTRLPWLGDQIVGH